MNVTLPTELRYPKFPAPPADLPTVDQVRAYFDHHAEQTADSRWKTLHNIGGQLMDLIEAAIGRDEDEVAA